MAYTQDGRRLGSRRRWARTTSPRAASRDTKRSPSPSSFSSSVSPRTPRRSPSTRSSGRRSRSRSAAGRLEAVHQRHLHRGRAGRARRHVHAVSPGPRAGGLPVVPEDAEPHLPADLGSRHPEEVLKDVDVTYEIKGTFQPRDYCVQYRESDFAFASRLMEEEGIYYFFKHKDGSHKMVVANTPGSHSDLSPGPSNLIFEAVGGGTREEDRVNAWEKAQELRPSKVTLWDHCFELPHKHLEALSSIPGSVAAASPATSFNSRPTPSSSSTTSPAPTRSALTESTREAASSRRRSRRSSRTTREPRT